MKWYLTPQNIEFGSWAPLSMGRKLPTIALPANEPTAAVYGDKWSLLPLTDTPIEVADDLVVERTIVIGDSEDAVAVAVYHTRQITGEERREATARSAEQNIISAPAYGFGGPTGKELFNGNR